MKKFKIFEVIIILLILNTYFLFKKLKIINKSSLASFKHFSNDCRNLIKYNRKPIRNKYPYISICLPAYNMEKYIQKVILSILNQSFQDFEIVIVNDNSKDNTKSIIQRTQLKDNRIKLINHKINLGVYNSRVDGILFSKGKFIMLMDPDDMLVNPKILKELYKYNLKYNLDIIEFTIICYQEIKSYFYINKKRIHHHIDLNKVISQPELSDIFFYYPGTHNYSMVQCRNIWNKYIRRGILLNAINYIGKSYYKKFFITAEDTILNLIIFHFAKNYSNINIPGYMYNIRKKSMTHGKKSNKHKFLFYYNHLLYLKKLYIYIKQFNKDRNFFYYELIEINKHLLRLYNHSKKFRKEIISFYNIIISDINISDKFKLDLKNLIFFLININYKIKI